VGPGTAHYVGGSAPENGSETGCVGREESVTTRQSGSSPWLQRSVGKPLGGPVSPGAVRAQKVVTKSSTTPGQARRTRMENKNLPCFDAKLGPWRESTNGPEKKTRESSRGGPNADSLSKTSAVTKKTKTHSSHVPDGKQGSTGAEARGEKQDRALPT